MFPIQVPKDITITEAVLLTVPSTLVMQWSTEMTRFTKLIDHSIFSLCFYKGWGLSAKLGKRSAIWGKVGTALQAYTLNPCTKFPPNPTSRKVNT